MAVTTDFLCLPFRLEIGHGVCVGRGWVPTGVLKLCSPDVLGETGIGFSVTWFLLHRCLASYSIWIAE